MSFDGRGDGEGKQKSCCRIVPLDKIKKAPSDVAHQPIYRQNAWARKIDSRKIERKSSVSDQAVRAKQRHMLKSLAPPGNVDRLAGRDREQQLRFGKSPIHGWGVFTEESINAGDMIIEYRGELIGNAVADKRELEYERAKIGSDYMFRMDEYTVCDATKLDNVA